MTIDRNKFFEKVRADPFHGNLTQLQVNALNYLLDVWEQYFARGAANDSTTWLAYCLATVFHETAETMEPIEEYGRGDGRDYGEKTGPHNVAYYGRGYPQLTWEENYEKGQRFLLERYKVEAPLHQYPHRMLEHETSALVLFDGMVFGWFTGVALENYFCAADGTEDPYNARRIVNGTDKAELIAGYYESFKAGLQ